MMGAAKKGFGGWGNQPSLGGDSMSMGNPVNMPPPPDMSEVQLGVPQGGAGGGGKKLFLNPPAPPSPSGGGGSFYGSRQDGMGGGGSFNERDSLDV